MQTPPAPGPASCLTGEAVHALARQREEPDWARSRRQEGWEAFQRLPFPARTDELWRRTDLTALPWGSFQPATSPPPSPERVASALRPRWEEGGPRAGVLVQVDGWSPPAQVEEGLRRRGVLFLPLEEAFREAPDLCRRFLGSLVPPGENRFTALHTAFRNGGFLLYVPPEVEVEAPFHALLVHADSSSSLFPHILVVAGRGSALTLVEEHLALPDGAGGPEALVLPVVEVIAEEGAAVRHLATQDLGPATTVLGFQRARVEGDAHFLTFHITLGGRLVKTFTESLLVGKGGRSDMLSLAFGSGSQHLDQVTLQDHQGPLTQSDLLYKTALKERARAAYYGTIKVRRGANGTDAFQTNRNLLLGRKAKADSVPVLEIEADDVRCSHAATVGPVEEEQLFYLMTRGLSRQEAERLLVEAFFEPLAARLPLEWLRERTWAALQQKMGEEQG